MSFELFTGLTIPKELTLMMSSLKPDNYAISTLDYDVIKLFAERHYWDIKLRRMDNGKVRVKLKSKSEKGAGE